MTTTPSRHAVRQYAATTDNLAARIALHAYGTNPVDWFSWLAGRIPLTGEVLEVGAGTGALWDRAGRAARARLTLTDFSAAMCQRLRTVAGARVQRCDATHLPFRAACFDTVVANHMLYHLDDPAAALREFARVLRPGGRVLIATNGADHLAELNAIGPAIGRPELGRHRALNDFTAETGPELVARHFTGVAAERYPCDLDIPSADPIIAYLASRVDEPLTAEQRAATRRIVLAGIDTHGSFHVRKHTVLITARR